MIDEKNQYKFAVFTGILAFLLVFLMNWKINLLLTSVIRGTLAFIIFFFIGIISHLLIFQMSPKAHSEDTGEYVNLETTQQDDHNLFKEVYQTEEETTLEPLEFKKIEMKDKNQVEQFVKGIRTLSSDE